MPKSKRNKQVELSKTKKQGMELKKNLMEEIRSSADMYTNLFVFSVNDMRNSKLKEVRAQWKHSRFFIGKNKVMVLALGKSPECEYKKNLFKISECLKGQRGLLFSNKSKDEVLNWFHSYSEADFARSGSSATETVFLPKGPLPQFAHSLEPYLRQLGLPTTLEKGIINLIQDHEVCKVGDILNPNTAKIVKLLGYEMAEFHIQVECAWSQDGTFINFNKESSAEDTDINGEVKNSPDAGNQLENGVAKESDEGEMSVDEDMLSEAESDFDKKSDTVEDSGKSDICTDALSVDNQSEKGVEVENLGKSELDVEMVPSDIENQSENDDDEENEQNSGKPKLDSEKVPSDAENETEDRADEVEENKVNSGKSKLKAEKVPSDTENETEDRIDEVEENDENSGKSELEAEKAPSDIENQLVNTTDKKAEKTKRNKKKSPGANKLVSPVFRSLRNRTVKITPYKKTTQ